MHFAADLDPATARTFAAAATAAHERFVRRYPDVPVALDLEIGAPRLVGRDDAAVLLCRVTLTLTQPALPDVGAYAGELVALTADDGEPLALFRGAGVDLDTDPAAGAIDHAGCLVCDACGVARRRKACYVFRRPDGTVTRVGGDCLERLRLGFAPALAALVAALDAAAAATAIALTLGGGGRRDGYHAEAFLAHVACAVRSEGWTSGRRARETGCQSTKNEVVRALSKARLGERCAYKPTPADHALAGEVLTWMRGLDVEAEGFFGSLAVLGRVGYWPAAVLGVGAAAIVSYWRAWADGQPAPAAGPYVAVPVMRGKRKPVPVPGTFQADVRVLRVAAFDGAYGPSMAITFRDVATGHDLVWLTSHRADVTVGMAGRLAGDVKGEGDFRGAHQVKVARCAWTPAT